MKKILRIAALMMALTLLWSLNAFAETKTVALTYTEAYSKIGNVPYGSFSSIDFTFGPDIRVHADQGSLQDGSFNLYVFSSGDKAVTFTAPDGWAIQSISAVGSGSAYPTAVTAGDFSRSGSGNWQWTDTTGNGMTQVTFKGAVTSSGEKITGGADINITNYYSSGRSTVVTIVLMPVVPATGDTTMPALWFCLMLVSAASILVLRKRAR